MTAPHPATLISQARLDAARPYIAMAMRGGGSVDDCIRAAIAAADQAGWQPIETQPGGGEYLVYVPTARPSKIQSAYSRIDANGKPIRVVGGLFSFDAEKATMWHPGPPLPPAPGDAP